MEKELICECGCPESMHIDGCEHCTCCVDCREFEEATSDEENDADDSSMEDTQSALEAEGRDLEQQANRE